MIAIHVGGYKAGKMTTSVAQDVSQYGFMGLAVEYRLAPPHVEMKCRDRKTNAAIINTPKRMCLTSVSVGASNDCALFCGFIALIQPIPASVILSETKKYSAHHATNAIAYAIQKLIPESKGKAIKRLHGENCAELFGI